MSFLAVASSQAFRPAFFTIIKQLPQVVNGALVRVNQLHPSNAKLLFMATGMLAAQYIQAGTARMTYCNGKASLAAISGSAPILAAIDFMAGKTFSRSGSLKILAPASVILNPAS